MSEKLNIKKTAVAKLFETHVDTFTEKQKRELIQMIVDATGSRMDDLINYLDDPLSYKYNDAYSIGDTVLVDKTTLYSNESKFYKENDMLVDDKWFAAKVISFNIIRGDYVLIEYPDEKGNLVKRETYDSYINKEKLL